MIRIPPEQHKSLAMKAAEMGISLNSTLKVLEDRYAHFEDKTLKKAISVFDNGDDSKAGFGKSLVNQ
jgi:HicB-like protein involved in pilus formation